MLKCGENKDFDFGHARRVPLPTGREWRRVGEWQDAINASCICMGGGK